MEISKLFQTSNDRGSKVCPCMMSGVKSKNSVIMWQKRILSQKCVFYSELGSILFQADKYLLKNAALTLICVKL